ncbi:SusD/RagB family nutrient-binding outer membrane lipoprotein [Bacteroides caccae]|uniref:SusD/RagB family nutrient-binding outer membrane lipoprotein n=1 Tax=Bacteroides caccae TaxID=47678 RepID=UPI002906958C|nr:SusD/RagB family nutrient-binding outer membrane lipoprotein [Bacteroides caccae]MDU3629284.1 SusD/RagB family nutrient-binding outer membrane lipoprotein [Bacteroides caccae]MDU3671819.1 SusD/RagB family nutrient-binding outer membrane lipoprotein [Bacteroides caccae]
MKQIFRKIVVVILVPLLAGCTGNFEEYNTDHYKIYKADPSTLLKAMIETMINIQQNDSQYMDQMVGTLGGYFTITNRWGGTNFDTFNQSDSWNAIPWEKAFTRIYGNFFQVQEATNATGHFYAMARLVRAVTMLRIIDCYGPMPYSKVKKGDFYVAYDSQEEVYKYIMEDCEYAANVLYTYSIDTSGNRPLGGNDPVYNGDYSKWAKLANSVRLRVAVRIGKVFSKMASQHAQAAITSKAGLIEANEDNAMLSCGSQTNPYYLAANTWGELRANASIVDYMSGYNDPRLGKYFTKSTFSGYTDKYIGMRSGTAGFSKDDVKGYSKPAYEVDSKLMIFCAAETAFLRAEGVLNGWSMGGKAKDFYNQGITLSMAQYGVSGDTYINNTELIPGEHSGDPRGSIYNYTPKTKITIAWDESATDEQKLERIITQKWIANYPLGLEAWAEYRRTGYPELFPCIDNLSSVVTDKVRGMRRLRYPYTEAQNNSQNYQNGVALLGGGPDDETTDLVFGKKN